jgi:hypothetical protein
MFAKFCKHTDHEGLTWFVMYKSLITKTTTHNISLWEDSGYWKRMGETFNVNQSSFQVDFLRSSSESSYLKLHFNKIYVPLKMEGHTPTQGLHKQ